MLTVITSAVDTQIFDNGPGMTLPEDSPYRPFLESIEKRSHTKGNEDLFPSWIPVDQFATKVVKDVTHQGKTGLTWRGASASLIRFVTIYVWAGLIESIFPFFAVTQFNQPVELSISLIYGIVTWRTKVGFEVAS